MLQYTLDSVPEVSLDARVPCSESTGQAFSSMRSIRDMHAPSWRARYANTTYKQTTYRNTFNAVMCVVCPSGAAVLHGPRGQTHLSMCYSDRVVTGSAIGLKRTNATPCTLTHGARICLKGQSLRQHSATPLQVSKLKFVQCKFFSTTTFME